MTTARPLVNRRAVAWLLAYYRPHTRRLALYAAGATVNTLLALPVLWMVRRSFDVAIPAGDVRGLVVLGGAILALRLVSSALSLGLRSLILGIVKGAITALRADLVAHLYGRSRSWLARADTALLQTRIVQDSERLDHLSNTVLHGIIPALIASALLVAVMAVLSWPLLLLAATIMPLLWLLNRRMGWLVKRDVFTFQRDFEGFSRGVQFALRQMDLTRLRAYDAQEQARQQKLIEDLRASGHRMAMSFALHSHGQRTLAGIAWILILIVGGAAVASGAMTMGGFLAFNVAAGMLKGHVDALLGEVPSLIAGHESLVTLRSLLDEGEAEPYAGTEPASLAGPIVLHDVHFGYDRPVLAGTDFRIEPGARVAVMGENGAGKTTILNLVLGFVRPSSGVVLASGVPYERLDLRSLRRAIGVVPQHPALFVGTARENVTYGLETPPTDAELAEAARLTSADAVIARLPQGWETLVGDRGATLSGGEAQRLAICRALLGCPRLLILDEPTNHLDAASIAPIMSAIRALPQRPAILLISHDPAVVAFADEVYRLEEGRLHRVRAPMDATADAR